MPACSDDLCVCPRQDNLTRGRNAIWSDKNLIQENTICSESIVWQICEQGALCSYVWNKHCGIRCARKPPPTIARPVHWSMTSRGRQLTPTASLRLVFDTVQLATEVRLTMMARRPKLSSRLCGKTSTQELVKLSNVKGKGSKLVAIRTQCSLVFA